MAVVLVILSVVILFTIPKYLELECKCKTGIKMIDVKISASNHHISEYRCHVQASKFRKSPSYSLGKPQTDFIFSYHTYAREGGQDLVRLTLQ